MSDVTRGPPRPGPLEGEAGELEHAELRRRLQRRASEALSLRADASSETRRARAARKADRPPSDAAQAGARGLALLRFALFLALVAAAWVLLQRWSFAAFRPDVEVLRVVAPAERVPSGETVTLGVRVVNGAGVSGSAFAVAVLSDGREIDGPTVAVPPHDSATLPVALGLPPGDHVLSVLAFDASREVRRIGSFNGLRLWVGDRELQLDGPSLPSRLASTDTVVVEFVATNAGAAVEAVPVLVFWSDQQVRAEVDGPPTELGPGEAGTLQVTIVPSRLPAGRYGVEVLVRTPQGERLAQGVGRIPVEIGS